MSKLWGRTWSNLDTQTLSTKDIISSGSVPGSPSGWIFQENLNKNASMRHSDQTPKPHQLAPFYSRSSGCRCPSSSPVLWGWAQPPYRGNSFRSLVSAVSFFRLPPRAHDHRWGLEHKSTGRVKNFYFQLNFLLTTMVCNKARLTARAATNHL